MGFASEVARSCGTFNVSFTTSGAYGTAAYVSLWLNLPHLLAIDGGFCEIVLRILNLWGLRLSRILLNFLFGVLDLCFLNVCSRKVKKIQSLNQEVVKIQSLNQEVVKIQSWNQKVVKIQSDPRSGKDSIFESKKGKDSIFESKKGKDSIFESRLGKEHGLSSEECISWLNEHPERSVVYISFGSQNTIGTSQMMALAMGLEESERPFIWVIRPPIGFDIKGEFRSEWLPKGFQERVSKSQKGLLVKSWAPQLQILSHSSTGAFLIHCGWNSVLESLSQGMPIISWPLAAEQTFNSKMLMEEMGVCVELTKWYSSDVDKEDVKEVVEIVLGENGKGKEMKEKAIELGMCIRDAVKEEEDFKGSSVKALDDFISTLLCRRNMSS
ncbi:hypothetical protein KY284_026459 [Solanum tuberosum]|nr:hypothetical protein KY284_026459 [Solanum tuberosum]